MSSDSRFTGVENAAGGQSYLVRGMGGNETCASRSAVGSQWENTLQDAQKVYTSYPPNPGGYFTRPP